MSKHLVDMASQLNDVMFNMLSLKHKLLIPEKKCQKCDQHTKDWLIINVCHHVLCLNCAKIEDGTTCCQICNIAFDSNKHVRTVTEMKIAFSQMEELVWKVIALERGTLDELYPDEEFNNEIKPDMIHINSIKSSLQKHLSIQNTESNEESNLSLSQSSVDLFEETEDSELPEQENYNQQSNESFPTFVYSNKNNETAASVVDIIAEWNTDSEDDTVLGDLQIKNSIVVDAAVSYPTHDQSTNNDNANENGQSSTATSSSASESEDYDLVEGTPDQSSSSDPGNHSVENKHINITFTNFDTEDDLEVLDELVDVFNLNIQMTWSDKITHLVVKTLPDGTCMRTTKFMNALLFNCFIISLEWAVKCLASKKLLPELDYVPFEMSGEPSPLVSWRVGRGIIHSPLEWTRDCILYFHSSVKYNEAYTDIIMWAQRAGFVISNNLGEFRIKDYKMRIILVDIIDSSNDVQSKLPNEIEIMSWICDYKGITVFLDWFLECLFRYRFFEINPEYQVVKLNSSIVEYVNMNESLFKFE